jgi:hypothetical protein
MEIDPDKAVPDIAPENNMPQQQPDPLAQAKAALLNAQTENTKAKTASEKGQTLYELLQTAQVAATVPGAATIADSLGQSIGFVDANGYPIAQMPEQPIQQQIPVQQNTSPMYPPVPQQPDSALRGIETQRNDGALIQ